MIIESPNDIVLQKDFDEIVESGEIGRAVFLLMSLTAKPCL